MSSPKVAFVIPCFNEAKTIRSVVERALNSVEGSKVYVYDNGSTDETVEEAIGAGALVALVPERGKGNVVRRMFADVDADVYVMLDGDGTYEIEATAEMVSLLLKNKADMVIGCRNAVSDQFAAYRFGHQIGNRVFTSILKTIFHSSCGGYSMRRLSTSSGCTDRIRGRSSSRRMTGPSPSRVSGGT